MEGLGFFPFLEGVRMGEKLKKIAKDREDLVACYLAMKRIGPHDK